MQRLDGEVIARPDKLLQEVPSNGELKQRGITGKTSEMPHGKSTTRQRVNY